MSRLGPHVYNLERMELWVTSIRLLLVVTMVPLLASCHGPIFPTEEEVAQYTAAQIGSVDGPWEAIQTGSATRTLNLLFSLTQQTTGQVQGSGILREAGAADSVPFTVTGTFHRPTLVLTFEGLVYEGRAVSGAFRGDYTKTGGISDSLRLTAERYERTFPMLLRERLQP